MLKIKNKIPSALTIGGKIVERIKMRNEVVWEKVVDADYFYVENTYNGTNTITVKQTIEGEPDSSLYTKTLQYSKDKTNWTTITLSDTAYNITLNQGEKVYFRNNEGVFNHYVIRGTEYASTKIIGNQSHNVGGNINTLVNYYTPNNLTLPQGVFFNVFRGNTNLLSAENLTLQPSSDGSLPVFAYLRLFMNCTSLINPPVLIAKTLSNSSYYSMFEGCTSLNNLTVYADDVSATNCTYNWLYNVAPEGIFNNYGSATYTINSPSGIPTGWVENKNEYFYIENTYAGTNTISLKVNQTLGLLSDLQYSKDKDYWTTFTPSTTTLDISLNQGEKLYIRGDANKGIVRLKISGSQNHIVGGNINTLINYNDPNNVVLSPNTFEYLFTGDEKLTSASNLILPATTLASNCYGDMFSGCTSLTSTPVLPATTLANGCYSYMFSGCTSLTSTPVLPATTLATGCYGDMFSGCTSLTSTPVLPATTLAEYCYNYMFLRCTSLVNTPVLPATTLAKNCYDGMFQGCTSLTSAPELPATTLVNGCYSWMFTDCTSLTSAPVLPATNLTLHCYEYMFYGCTSLNSITVYANYIYEYDYTFNWLYDVSSTGTFYNYGSATYELDSVSGIPTNWKEVKE